MKHRLAAVILFSLLCSMIVPVADPIVSDVADVKVLALITDGFGWNYFDAVELLESWGVNVTTIGYSLDYVIQSCPNREIRNVTVDLLLSEITNQTLLQYDCLFLPSGGHWHSLYNAQPVLDTIAIAYDLGLSIAAICTGNKVLAHANGIVNGSNVVNFFLSYSKMILEGATVRMNYEVIVDNRLITGGAGGGTGEGGWEVAPTSEVCAEVIKEALGLSYITDVTLTPSSGVPGTGFVVSASISDLEISLGEYVSTEISDVTAQIYLSSNRTLVESVPLTMNNQSGRFEGSFTLLSQDSYALDLEVEDTNGTLEIARGLVEFTVGDSYLPAILAISAGGTVLLVSVIYIFLKRKGR